MKLWDFIMLKLKTSFETLKAEYEAHEANENAHNVDRFIEKDVANTLLTNSTLLEHETDDSGYSIFLRLERIKRYSFLIRNRGILQKTKDLSKTYFAANIMHQANYSYHEGADGEKVIGVTKILKEAGSNKSYYQFTVHTNTEEKNVLELHDDRIDFMNRALKDPYNLAASALSGTPRVVVIMIGSTPYYFGVYPVKA